MSDQGIAWDYEDGAVPPYYYIYAVNGPLEDKFDSLCLDIPLTEENTKDIEAIVEVLRKIAERAAEIGAGK